jgi:hypothetical protein
MPNEYAISITSTRFDGDFLMDEADWLLHLHPTSRTMEARWDKSDV